MIGEVAREGIVMASMRPSTAGIEHTFSCSVDQLRGPQDVDALRGGNREEHRDGGGENELGTIDSLAIHTDMGAGAEIARRVQDAGDRTDEHGQFGRVSIAPIWIVSFPARPMNL